LQALRHFTEHYAYDPIGNVEKMAQQAVNGHWTRCYTYDEASLIEPFKNSNRLSQTALHSNDTLPVEHYHYDIHGNITQMPHLPLMQWNFKDELCATSKQVVNTGTAETTYYVYDAGGQRVRKVTEGQNGAKKNERFYLGGFEVYREYECGGAITLERETLQVMDDKQRIALVETQTIDRSGAIAFPNPALRYQLANHLGSASLELDPAGGLISYEEYSPYGNTTYQAGRSAAEVSLKRYRYTGKERDMENGFTYHGARYYAAWLGRWVSCDRMGVADGPNLYTYVGNTPNRFVDPTGHQAQDPAKKSDLKPSQVTTPDPPPSAKTDAGSPPAAKTDSPIPEQKGGPIPEIPPVKKDLIDDEKPVGAGQLPFLKKPDTRPIYANVVNSSTTQGKGNQGVEGDLVLVKDSEGKYSFQPRVALSYGATRYVTVGGDVQGIFTGGDGRGASFGATVRVGSPEDPGNLKSYEGFGIVSTLRVTPTVGGTSVSGSFTGTYSVVPKPTPWLQIDANIYLNPDKDKTAAGGIAQAGVKIPDTSLTGGIEAGGNVDLRAPDPTLRFQGGIGLTQDTSQSTVEKSQRSLYIEFGKNYQGWSVSATLGGSFSGKGIFF